MLDKENTFSFPDPAKHPEWTPPQSKEFYSRLVEEYGKYKYPWNSQFDEPTAEMILAEYVFPELCGNARVLDVGCGHGEFTLQFASKANEVVGIDITEGFIASANKKRKTDNTRFLLVNADDRLLFPDNYFDVAYTKKGPTSWYTEGNRVVKPGGLICGLYHGGTDGGLRSLFPGLYSPVGKVDFNRAIESLGRNLRLKESGLTEIHFQPIEEIEYLSAPEDVLKKKCFGQSKRLKEYVWKECLKGVEEIFYKNATSRGLKVITQLSHGERGRYALI